MSGLILYTTEDGASRIQLRADRQTVWLTQLEMAELFQTSKQNIAKHLKAIFADGDLHPVSVVNHWLTTAADGKNYQVTHYNRDAILAVGYRVRSPRGVQFRRWASTVLLDDGSVVKESLTTAADGKRCRTSSPIFGLSRTATAKESLTVRIRNVVQATTEESSVVPMRRRCQGSRHVHSPEHIHKRQRFLSERAA